jgi:NADPH:quinone reductase-like Zn-dependent oxidoreductase
LITGGTGGVGHFGIQLARLGGAEVVATVRRAEQSQFVRDAGAQEVVVGDEKQAIHAAGPFDHVLDGVGGNTLGAALESLAKNGTAVVYGPSGGFDIAFDVRAFYPTGGASLYGFILFHELLSNPAGVGLARLLRLLADGRLRAPIEIEGKLADIGDLAQRLEDRAFSGKAVVHFV